MYGPALSHVLVTFRAPSIPMTSTYFLSPCETPGEEEDTFKSPHHLNGDLRVLS